MYPNLFLSFFFFLFLPNDQTFRRGTFEDQGLIRNPCLFFDLKCDQTVHASVRLSGARKYAGKTQNNSALFCAAGCSDTMQKTIWHFQSANRAIIEAVSYVPSIAPSSNHLVLVRLPLPSQFSQHPF
jgi:hypothetical protein